MDFTPETERVTNRRECSRRLRRKAAKVKGRLSCNTCRHMLLLRVRAPHEKKHVERPQLRARIATVYAMKISKTSIFKTRR